MTNLGSSRLPTVWVIEQGSFDYSPARVFGAEIRILHAEALTPNAPAANWHSKVIHQMRQDLADYIPGLDYVIPTGRPVRMVLAAMILREKGPRHNILGWDDRTQRYFLYELDLSQIIHRG